MPDPIAVDALVFDAYGTLFDVHSVTAEAERRFPGTGAPLSQLWRTKQLEYSWLTGLMVAGTNAAGVPRPDFAELTANALDYALSSLGLIADPEIRTRLLGEYRNLSPFAEVAGALAALAPRPRWILSNGTLAMLEPLVRKPGVSGHIDGILSVDAAGAYKPHPRVYQLAVDALSLPPARIGFVSSNGWDAVGAKAFGFRTFWINRSGAPAERHGPAPDRELANLAELLAHLA